MAVDKNCVHQYDDSWVEAIGSLIKEGADIEKLRSLYKIIDADRREAILSSAVKYDDGSYEPIINALKRLGGNVNVPPPIKPRPKRKDGEIPSNVSFEDSDILSADPESAIVSPADLDLDLLEEGDASKYPTTLAQALASTFSKNFQAWRNAALKWYAEYGSNAEWKRARALLSRIGWEEEQPATGAGNVLTYEDSGRLIFNLPTKNLDNLTDEDIAQLRSALIDIVNYANTNSLPSISIPVIGDEDTWKDKILPLILDAANKMPNTKVSIFSREPSKQEIVDRTKGIPEAPPAPKPEPPVVSGSVRPSKPGELPKPSKALTSTYRPTAKGWLRTKGYVETGEDGAQVLIDAPHESSGQLEAASGNAKDVLLTHSHYDHTAGLRALANALPEGEKLNVYIHEDEAEALRASDHFDESKMTLVPFKDSDIITVGGREYKALHMPGHSPGGSAFVRVNEDGSKELFVGDSMKRRGLPFGIADNRRESSGKDPDGRAVTPLPFEADRYLDTLDGLRYRPEVQGDTTVHDGHSSEDSYKLSDLKDNKELQDKLEERREARRASAQAPSSAEELADENPNLEEELRLFSKMPPGQSPIDFNPTRAIEQSDAASIGSPRGSNLGLLHGFSPRTPVTVTFNGRSYAVPSELVYQASKFINNPEIQEQILSLGNDYNAAKEASRIAEVNKDKVRADWPKVRTEVMRNIARLKAQQNIDDVTDLFLAKPGDFVSNAEVPSDDPSFWGARRIDDKWAGRNILGQIWDRVREEALAGTIPQDARDRVESQLISGEDKKEEAKPTKQGSVAQLSLDVSEAMTEIELAKKQVQEAEKAKRSLVRRNSAAFKSAKDKLKRAWARSIVGPERLTPKDVTDYMRKRKLSKSSWAKFQERQAELNRRREPMLRNIGEREDLANGLVRQQGNYILVTLPTGEEIKISNYEKWSAGDLLNPSSDKLSKLAAHPFMRWSEKVHKLAEALRDEASNADSLAAGVISETLQRLGVSYEEAEAWREAIGIGGLQTGLPRGSEGSMPNNLSLDDVADHVLMEAYFGPDVYDYILAERKGKVPRQDQVVNDMYLDILKLAAADDFDDIIEIFSNFSTLDLGRGSVQDLVKKNFGLEEIWSELENFSYKDFSELPPEAVEFEKNEIIKKLRKILADQGFTKDLADEIMSVEQALLEANDRQEDAVRKIEKQDDAVKNAAARAEVRRLRDKVLSELKEFPDPDDPSVSLDKGKKDAVKSYLNKVQSYLKDIDEFLSGDRYTRPPDLEPLMYALKQAGAILGKSRKSDSEDIVDAESSQAVVSYLTGRLGPDRATDVSPGPISRDVTTPSAERVFESVDWESPSQSSYSDSDLVSSLKDLINKAEAGLAGSARWETLGGDPIDTDRTSRLSNKEIDDLIRRYFALAQEKFEGESDSDYIKRVQNLSTLVSSLKEMRKRNGGDSLSAPAHGVDPVARSTNALSDALAGASLGFKGRFISQLSDKQSNIRRLFEKWEQLGIGRKLRPWISSGKIYLGISRDPNKESYYASEQKITHGLLSKKFSSIEEAQEYLDKIINSEWFKKTYPDIKKVTVEMRTTKRSRGTGWIDVSDKDKIFISDVKDEDGSFSFLTEGTILHELAHIATGPKSPLSTYPHGEEFAANHINIVSRVAGEDAGSSLRQALEKGKIPISREVGSYYPNEDNVPELVEILDELEKTTKRHQEIENEISDGDALVSSLREKAEAADEYGDVRGRDNIYKQINSIEEKLRALRQESYDLKNQATAVAARASILSLPYPQTLSVPEAGDDPDFDEQVQNFEDVLLALDKVGLKGSAPDLIRLLNSKDYTGQSEKILRKAVAALEDIAKRQKTRDISEAAKKGASALSALIESKKEGKMRYEIFFAKTERAKRRAEAIERFARLSPGSSVPEAAKGMANLTVDGMPPKKGDPKRDEWIKSEGSRLNDIFNKGGKEAYADAVRALMSSCRIS